MFENCGERLGDGALTDPRQSLAGLICRRFNSNQNLIAFHSMIDNTHRNISTIR
jgi:hypothetical protein